MAEARYKIMWTFLIESNYGDAADIGSDMRCTICTRILINAHNSVCGCRYCLDCVKAYLNRQRRFCPGNTDDCKAMELDIDSNISPDHAMNYRISKLIVSCRYSCGYRCELRNMRDHDISCQKQPKGHSDVMKVKDRTKKPTVEKDQLHETLELRSEMAQMRLAREIDEARARHTNELVVQIKQELADLRNENKMATKKINSMETRIYIYRVLFFLSSLVIGACMGKYLLSTSDTNHQIMELRTIIEAHGRGIDVLTQTSGKVERETQMRNEKLQRNIDLMRENQETELNSVERRVREIEMISATQNQAEFVWPIDGWAAKLASARDGINEWIFSDPFYSHRNGYKMCLSMLPNGDADAKGTHLSVFFHLVRGPFDNILSWPFGRTVTLSIINQHTGLNHVSVLVKQEHYLNNTDWDRPPKERNRGYGRSKMIELAALSTNHKLCQDDRIFIRCVVK